MDTQCQLILMYTWFALKCVDIATYSVSPNASIGCQGTEQHAHARWGCGENLSRKKGCVGYCECAGITVGCGYVVTKAGVWRQSHFDFLSIVS